MGGLAVISSVANAFMPRAQGNPFDDAMYEPVGRRSAGQVVTPRTALTFSGCWAATNEISGLFGQLPLKSFKKTESGRDEATKHPTYNILSRRPNPDMDSFVFWEMMTQWWVNYGNAFAEIQRLEDSGRLYALWPIHPTRVRPEQTASGSWTGRWQISSKHEQAYYLEQSEVLNVIGALSDDGLTGKGVLEYAAKSIGIGLAEQSYKGEFFASGGLPSGVLEHPSKLSPTARDELRRDWKSIQKGNDIAILWEGMKFNTVSSTPDTAKLLEAQLFSIQEMSRFYDLPPHVLYELSKGTFANVEEMNRFLVSHSFGKRLTRVEKALDRQLFTDDEQNAGYYVKFNVNAILRGDPKQQAEINQIMMNSGVLSQDDWRKQLDMNKLPDGKGESYWIRRDMATLDLVLAADDLAQSAPIPDTPPTPETPPTPPVPGDAAAKWRKRAKLARQQADQLQNVLGGKETELASISDRLAQVTATASAAEQLAGESEAKRVDAEAKLTAATSEYETHLDALRGLRDGLTSLADDLKAQLAAESAAAIEYSARAETLTASIASLEADNADLLASRDTLTDKLSAAELARQNIDSELALAKSQANETSEQLSATLIAKNDALAELETLQSKLTYNEATAEAVISKANKRADSLKDKADSLATDLGVACAERDTFRKQAETLTDSTAALSDSLATTRRRLEAAEKQAETALDKANAAGIEAKQSLEAVRMDVAASVRGLLDESLKFLLTQERDEIKNASRKPDQFKQIADSYYHRFQESLTAQLTHAAAALELVGAKRHDASKTAAEYVSDSRTRVHNLIHKTPKDDLRTAARQEVESWEARRQTLLNWIGE